MEKLLLYVVTLALFASIPMILDIVLAYRSIGKISKQLVEKLIEKASNSFNFRQLRCSTISFQLKDM